MRYITCTETQLCFPAVSDRAHFRPICDSRALLDIQYLNSEAPQALSTRVALSTVDISIDLLFNPLQWYIL